jgi:hypothetical protein
MENKKHSGQVWSIQLRIPILDPQGWVSIDDFNHRLITKEEFCNRAANSVVKVNKELSRRAASKMLKKI